VNGLNVTIVMGMVLRITIAVLLKQVLGHLTGCVVLTWFVVHVRGQALSQRLRHFTTCKQYVGEAAVFWPLPRT
jgi:hypothetical protein